MNITFQFHLFSFTPFFLKIKKVNLSVSKWLFPESELHVNGRSIDVSLGDNSFKNGIT